MMTIKVEPKEVHIGAQKIADVSYITLRNIVIRELNGWAQVYHDLYDLEDDLIASRDIKIEGAHYEAWGDDDEYLVDFILGAYGLERRVPDWVQPTIVEEGEEAPEVIEPPYATGDTVRHADEVWTSAIDDNFSEPAVGNSDWTLQE